MTNTRSYRELCAAWNMHPKNPETDAEIKLYLELGTLTRKPVPKKQKELCENAGLPEAAAYIYTLTTSVSMVTREKERADELRESRDLTDEVEERKTARDARWGSDAPKPAPKRCKRKALTDAAQSEQPSDAPSA